MERTAYELSFFFFNHGFSSTRVARGHKCISSLSHTFALTHSLPHQSKIEFLFIISITPASSNSTDYNPYFPLVSTRFHHQTHPILSSLFSIPKGLPRWNSANFFSTSTDHSASQVNIVGILIVFYLDTFPSF